MNSAAAPAAWYPANKTDKQKYFCFPYSFLPPNMISPTYGIMVLTKKTIFNAVKSTHSKWWSCTNQIDPAPLSPILTFCRKQQTKYNIFFPSHQIFEELTSSTSMWGNRCYCFCCGSLKVLTRVLLFMAFPLYWYDRWKIFLECMSHIRMDRGALSKINELISWPQPLHSLLSRRHAAW